MNLFPISMSPLTVFPMSAGRVLFGRNLHHIILLFAIISLLANANMVVGRGHTRNLDTSFQSDADSQQEKDQDGEVNDSLMGDDSPQLDSETDLDASGYFRPPSKSSDRSIPKNVQHIMKSADVCDERECKLPDCWCSATRIPGGLPIKETPQIIMIAFDDAVHGNNYNYYTELFGINRTNPNGCPISGTFFVSHDWTDYTLVQRLYSQGHEIASHSINHQFPPVDATKKFWAGEISGQRDLIKNFANIPVEDIKGMRAPFLQGGGNQQLQMMKEKGFTYDSSLVTDSFNPPLWPYTFDYAIPHRCLISPCPTEPFPGIWEIPLIDWEDPNGGGQSCSMVDACSDVPTTEEHTYELIMHNYQIHYKTNRAPFGIFVHAAWFLNPGRFAGLKTFLRKVLKDKNVWVVSASQTIEWIRNPEPLSKIAKFKPWNCKFNGRPPACEPTFTCETVVNGELRPIESCTPCA